MAKTQALHNVETVVAAIVAYVEGARSGMCYINGASVSMWACI